MTKEKQLKRTQEIEAAAAAIRQELSFLLSDYGGDETLRTDPSEEPDPSRRLIAEIRLYAFDYIEETWCSGKGASEERMIGVAKAALEAAENIKNSDDS